MIVVWVKRESVPAQGARNHWYHPLAKPKAPSHRLTFLKEDRKNLDMFDRNSLDNLFDELRDEYELEPDWEDIQRDAHLAVARHDAGMPLGEVDNRVGTLVNKHSPD